MFESIYAGLTGLSGFSKGLNVISNNVANLNTPGFKSSQLQFLDLFYQYNTTGHDDDQSSALQIGAGMNTGATNILFKQGELRQTGNDQDVAIDGTGFFVLRKDGQTYYTRAGQFQFDADGYLVERSNNARVAGLQGNNLSDINITGLRTSPAKVTSVVKFSNNLSTGSTQHIIDNIAVYDALGGSHTLKLTLDNNNANLAGSWNLTVTDSGTAIATGQIQFDNGLPKSGADKFTFAYAPTGATPLSLTFDFSTDATSFSGGTSSTLQLNSQDGYAVGSLTKTTFDPQGYMVTTYSNGQTTKHDRLALAWFDNAGGLEQFGGNMFVNNLGQKSHIGGAGESVLGKITGGSVELSNVDLTQQFSDLIITQRGYQGSSQIITTANEMIQQLFDMRGRR